jgi:penicillin amidase
VTAGHSASAALRHEIAALRHQPAAPRREVETRAGRRRIRPAVALALVLAAVVGQACGRRPEPPVAAGAPGASGAATRVPPPPDQTFAVAGLGAPVEILVDRWGVPHIYAANEDDLFLAQGWNAARDRLWQLDLWKRRGDGTLAEALGPQFVTKDRAARLFLYRGGMDEEWRAYAGDAERIVTAFVAGINAYMALTEERPDLLPPEFRLLDYRPACWTKETVTRIRSHGLLRNARSEVKRALFLRRFGETALALRDRFEPGHRLEIPAGLDLEALDEHTLDDYELGTGVVSFAALLEQGPAVSTRHDGGQVGWSGSNNWALRASRTTTGRPILANDPHRSIDVPSLRYLVHLSSPSLELAGAGEPALPGVSLGHNGRIAFGFTIFAMDQEDLYVVRTRPGHPTQYEYQGRWEPMTEVRERVPVRGGDPAGVEVVLRFTRHGPVIAENAERAEAIVLRAAWLEPGMAPYLGSLALQRVSDWNGFVAALDRWGLPGENLVYADVDGAIGWKPAGRSPIRAGWDGLLPVPGDGRYEWTGYLGGDALPVEANPDRGWVATANQMNLPAAYPHSIAYEWAPPFRYERIVEVLSGERLSIEDAARLQTDYVSLAARPLVARLEGLDGTTELQIRALAMLRGWDCRLAPRSGAAALFEVWLRRHLPAAVWSRVARAEGLPEDAALALQSASVPALLAAIESVILPPDERRAALLESLGAAAVDVEERLGPDSKSWHWGALHHAWIEHPLSRLLRAKLGVEADLGPIPRGGSGETPGATTYRSSDFRQESGASVRLVLDVGAWDGSVAMNTPGQSGVPGSEHYGDLFKDWAAGRSFPFLWSRDRVEAETTLRIRLEPGPNPAAPH